MKALRRFTDHKPAGKPMELSFAHPAVLDRRTLFPKRVSQPDEAIQLFKSGQNSRKIGSRVTKGKWKGMPIYTLTLEERATCPTVCEHWQDCFGNKMHWPTRWQQGKTLESLIPIQLRALAHKHSKGFVVRLHVLGDFYSPDYAQMWRSQMEQIPQLHVFGYTRRHTIQNSVVITAIIEGMNNRFPDRWSIRWSGRGGEMGTKSITDVTVKGNTPDGIVCPAQTGRTECCGTCGLCWNSTKPIVFITH